VERSSGLNNSTILLNALICILCVLSVASMSYATPASYEMPSAIDSSARYVFFLHNYYVEKHGPNGACKYHDILKAFTDNGFTVISEVRSGKIVPSQYAQKIIRQVERLLDAGVPPERITVAGHSKGGVITLCVASQLGNPKIGFIVMAGCDIKSLAQAYPDFTQLKGEFLSIYASSDSIANNCQNVFSKAIIGICYKEITLNSDKGHRLFFQPEEIWVEPVMAWINQRGTNGH
jgi:pimeloyl-ACP methyl ester carboxylesterase